MTTSRIAAKPVVRIAGAAALATAALLGMSACSLVAPVATLIEYDPADGVGADLGDVKVRDAQALIGDSGAISIYLYVINSGAETAQLNVALGEGGTDGTETLTLRAGTSSTVGGPDDTDSIIVEDPTAALLGGLYPVYVQVGDEPGQVLQLPVLDATDRPFFEDYLP